MLRWHEQRAIILQLLTALEDASVQVKRYRTQEGRLVATLVDAMIAFVDGGPLPPFDSLPAARAQATQILSDLDSAKAHQQSRAAARVQAQLEQEQAQVAQQKAIAEGQALSKRWQAALDGLHIATDITADKIEPYLRLVERYRSLADEVNLLRLQQIGTINRDTAAFETQAVALAAAIAPDLCDKPADSLTLELAQRNEAEQRKAERQAFKPGRTAGGCNNSSMRWNKTHKSIRKRLPNSMIWHALPVLRNCNGP